MPEQTNTELAEVHYLPTSAAEETDHTKGEVIEGELVTDAEYERLTSQKELARARYAGYRRDVEVVAKGARQVATHPVTRSAGVRVLSAGVCTAQGFHSWGQRLWDTSTHATYRRQIAAAEAAGDREATAEWMDRLENAKDRRHKRVMDLPKLAANVAKVALGSLAAFVVLVLITGILVTVTGTAAFMDPIYGVFSAIRWVIVAISIGWTPALAAAPLVLLLAAWREGRKRQTPPMWLQRVQPGSQDGGTVVTADAIVRALQKLNISALNREFKNGWVPEFELTPIREGRGKFKGYRTRFTLPGGVPASAVADKREVLAHNLHRDEIEVWPTDYGKVKGGRRGYLDLYVADAGVMEQPTPAYPLLTEGTADVFAGVPVGINQRGDEMAFPLVGANVGVGGQPGQGKSNLMRAIFLGAALDPLAELRVHVFAGNGDFDEYAPRLSCYDKGADAAHVERAVEHLHELYAEVERRESRLSELGAKKASRALAEKHPDLRPLIVGFSECHEMFSCESAVEEIDEEGNVKRSTRKLGKEASELAVQVVKRGRKTGVVTLYDTQSSRANAIPPALVEQLGINSCFYVKSWRNNDGFLGDGSFSAGIRATDLRFNIDRGTCVAVGISEELFEIVRTYYIEVDDDRGWDAATDVIARAMQAVDPKTPIDGQRDEPTEPVARDLLEDLDAVLGTEATPAADVPAQLRKIAPTWPGYKDLTGKQLRAELAEHGVKVASTGNRWPVDPAAVRAALAARSTADLDE